MKEHASSITIRPSVLYYGTPIALLSSLNDDGTTNLAPNSCSWALADRVVFGLEATAQTLANIERVPECVVNLPGPSQWQHVEQIAPTTGRRIVPRRKRAQGYVFEPRKFDRASLSPIESETVRPARVADFPLQLEAEVVAILPTTRLGSGDRGAGLSIVEARVTRVHAHSSIVVPGTHHIDPLRWSPLLYVFRQYFGTGERLGRDFKDELLAR